ncbi:flagellar basal-body MS-ring/collar protein FliF [Legionella sp. km772]|uniref:flagellar basal-body MS-ring/collar protein FliF n=1 Tax=Legionella sp. km772 TaxID=2498111 RepID=UPI000F8F5315|nr:flagellar basal-body MS-ring/collar protein FliF [Legionella sp. km772]RUR10540.1 flagellar basal body M-ring protein FliF [Legionella sp. km772]
MALGDNASTVAAKFASLSIPRQIGLLVGLAASIALGIAVAFWSREPDYAPLYAQVNPRDSSEIVTALERYGVVFKIDQNTGTILVPNDQLQMTRLKLAAEGLPRESNSVNDMFANNGVFSNSQFMENARYKQGLESELARTISKFNEIKSARVHLAIPKESAFVRDSQQPSASVFVDVYPGVELRKQTIASIVNLVASSIPNLNASMVTVVDQDGQLLNEGGGQTILSETDRFFDYRQSLEQQYAQKIQDILTPIFGIGRVKVKVSADIDFTSYEQTQELFNPELPALRSEQTMEEKRNSTGGAGGVPGTLSNLPQPTTGGRNQAAGGRAQVNSSLQTGAQGVDNRDTRTQSTKNFELDKTISHTKNQPGTIKRLTVAVLVDNKAAINPKTKKLEKTPLTAKEIDQIKLLVTDAVGLNAKRGDSLNVINSDFIKPETIEPLPEEKFWQKDIFWSIVKQAAGGLFLLIMVFGLLRPILKTLASNKAAEELAVSPVAGAGAAAPASGESGAVSASESFKNVTDYESQLGIVRQISESEPKRVAQVVKNWVDRG